MRTTRENTHTHTHTHNKVRKNALGYKRKSLRVPNTPITKVVSGSHENTVKGDERAYYVVCFDGSRTVFDGEVKGEIPHETSLFV